MQFVLYKVEVTRVFVIIFESLKKFHSESL